MVDWSITEKLMRAFPCSFINQRGEIIVHYKANSYFILKSCENEFDVKCKILEWLSRDAYKTAPFGDRKNKEFHEFILNGINRYLGTDFSYSDMDEIYTYLGNSVNHVKTIRFIESGYDMSVLKGGAE